MTLPGIRTFAEFNEWRAAEHKCSMWRRDVEPKSADNRSPDSAEWVTVCEVCGEIGTAASEVESWNIGAGHVMLMRAISPDEVNKR